MANSTILHTPPTDATLTVTRAARVLGIHPNTVRAWSDAGRLRYYRINARGDRRYRVGDLNRFLAGAAEGPSSDQLPGTRPGRRRTPASAIAESSWSGGPESPAEAPRTQATPDRTRTEALVTDAHSAISVMSGLGRIAASMAEAGPDPESALGTAARLIREGAPFRHVSVWRRSQDRLEPVAVSGPSAIRLTSADGQASLFLAALSQPGVVSASGWADDPAALRSIQSVRITCTIPGPDEPWGLLLAIPADDAEPGAIVRALVAAAADGVGAVIRAGHTACRLERRMHWAEALGRVAVDIGSRLDPDQLLGRLVDHAIAMFGAERAAVFLLDADGSRRTVASRGLSATYLAALSSGDRGGLTSTVVKSRRPVFAVGFRDDPRAAEFRASVVQEGYDSICLAPLVDADSGEAIGSLNVYHDRPHPWSADEIGVLAQLADQASAAIRSARTYAQLATWAAQLQSIQQLGARLNRLTDVAAIGEAIATELRELIDYHNVRVYRQYGDDLVPVAMRGQVGEYLDETADQLRIKVGHGITGWVAAHRIAESLPEAAADPRATQEIPWLRP